MDAIAASADGRTVAFEAPLGAPLPPGGFAVLGTEPPQLALITECAMAAREADGRRTFVLQGSARVLDGDAGGGGFAAVPIEAAPSADGGGLGGTGACRPAGSTSARSRTHPARAPCSTRTGSRGTRSWSASPAPARRSPPACCSSRSSAAPTCG